MAFSLLHLSICLFFGGLVIAFHTINKKVAIAVDVAVGLFGLAYIALSILPCLDVRCPYRTPMSYLLWYPWHTFFSIAALLHRRFAIQAFEAHESWPYSSLYNIMARFAPNLQANVQQAVRRLYVGMVESGENAFKIHWRYIKDGLGKSIINGAINSQREGDLITRLFDQLVLGDESKLRKFAASIPRNRVLELIPPIKSGRIVREPLTSLLRSCAASIRVAGFDEDVRKRSLLVCLDAIHYIAKTPTIPEINFVRANFANIGLMQEFWGDSDTAICVTSRSICALVARQVIREPTLEGPQLQWLQEVTGKASNTIYTADTATRDHMNLKSFVYGVLSNRVGDLPTEVATSFKETLATLLDVGNYADFDTNFQRRLSEEIGWIQQDDPQGSDEVVDKLRSIFPFLRRAPP
jgi:hypothetical protein